MKSDHGKLLRILALLVLFFRVDSILAADPRYAITDLGTLGGTVAYGINDLGQVVGVAGRNAFFWDPVDGMLLLDHSEVHHSVALDINNSGQIVGALAEKGVLWHNGTVIDLGTIGVEDSPAVAINSSGQVVGYQHTSPTDSSSPYRAWVWDSANGMRDLVEIGDSKPCDINDSGVVAIGNPAAIWLNGMVTSITSGQAHAINNRNQVVGRDGSHAFLWENGTLTDLGTIGDARSGAKAINEKGQVVGQLTFSEYEHAMFWQEGKMVDLNDLIDRSSGFVLTTAFDINDRGQIVGMGIVNGERHAFLLTPIIRFDTDNDGIPDDKDQCMNSRLGPTVVIDGCDSGVPNTLLSDGCTISDKMNALAENSNSHTQFTRAVSYFTGKLMRDGFITGKHKAAIQRCVARADIP